MNDKEVDKLIREALRSEQELPDGLSDRLEQYIDQLAEEEKKKQKPPLMKRRSMYWLSGVAASFLLGVIFFFQAEKAQPTIKDTYSDPYEAAIAAQDALAFLSTQLNKGLDQVSEAKEEVDKVNDIVVKQLNVQ